MEDMAKALMKARLTLEPGKARFGRSHVKYLGYFISQSGSSIGNGHIQAMVDLSPPSNIKGLRSILEGFIFVIKFIKRYADMVAPLVNLTHRETAQQKSQDAC